MKQVIVALVLLAAVAALVTWNGCYLTTVCGELLEMCEKLPESREEFRTLSPDAAETILEKFKKSNGYMNLSLPFPEIREAEQAITDLISYIRTKSYGDYIAAREKSILALKRLQKYEIPTLEHLL